MEITYSLSEIDEVADAILQYKDSCKTFCFEGNLGAGKTTLIKSIICEKLNVNSEVSSPTFSIINEYSSSDNDVIHIDLYRLKTETELHNIAFYDYMDSDALCFIEWYQIAASHIPRPYVLVEIALAENGSRKAVITQINE